MTRAHRIALLLLVVEIAAGGNKENVDERDVDRVCQGFEYFRQRELDRAMPLLLSTKVQDANVYEHVGAGFGMMARRLASLTTHTEKEREALRQSVVYFERAANVETENVSPYVRCNVRRQMKTQVVRAHGDALAWLGREDEAARLFAESKLWMNPMCRPVHNGYVYSVDDLPYIFQGDESSYLFRHVLHPVGRELVPQLKQLTQRSIKMTYAELVKDGWSTETAGLTSRGGDGSGWLLKILYANGEQGEACRDDPRLARACSTLAELLRKIPALNLKEGQIKLSVMRPGTVVRPHAGPTRDRLRSHCTLHAPPPGSSSGMRVGDLKTGWKADACFVFRESCEHSVRIDPEDETNRVVLIVDFAQPFVWKEVAYHYLIVPEIPSDRIREEFKHVTSVRSRWRKAQRGGL